jgi:hypothetical protein
VGTDMKFDCETSDMSLDRLFSFESFKGGNSFTPSYP